MRPIVVMISRGVAPARCVLGAIEQCVRLDSPFVLVDGLAAPDAKNRAVEIAMENGRDLLLVEDDFTATPLLWEKAVSFIDGDRRVVMFAAAPCRNGNWNVRYNASGGFLYAGTVMLRVNYPILEELCRGGPVFVPGLFAHDLSPVGWHKRNGVATRGMGSDLTFWWKVQEMPNRPRIICLGPVTHWKQEWTQEYNLDNPVALQPYEPNKPFEEAKKVTGIEYV